LSNTHSAGSPNPPNTAQTPDHTPQSSPRAPRGLLPLLIALLAVGLAIYIGTQVVGVLYSMVAPPLPPKPDSLTELSHTNDAYGVDTWQYATDQDACSLARYYESSGATCIYAPDRCEGGFVDLNNVQQGDNVAQCYGSTRFSIFAMTWEAIIATGYSAEQGVTQFLLSREVYWTGEVPDSEALQDLARATAVPTP
jgi:hypothetical protein